MDGVNRLKRRLFDLPSSQRPSKVLNISLERENDAVSNDGFWSSNSSKSFHQSPKNANSITQTHVYSFNCIYGRYTHHESVISRGSIRPSDGCGHDGRPGFFDKQRKIGITTETKIEFLCYMVDSIEMSLSLPKGKIMKIKQCCLDMLSDQSVTVRKLAQLIGKLTATNQTILVAPLHYRNLQNLKTKGLHAGGHYDCQVFLDQDSISEIRWWISQLELWNGKTLLKTSPYTILQSEASLMLMGRSMSKIQNRGFTDTRREVSSYQLPRTESNNSGSPIHFKGFHKQACICPDGQQHSCCLCQRNGGTVSKVLSNQATLLWNWCLDRQITLTAEYIPGTKNSIADWESRNFLDKTSWRLNPQIFKQLQVLLGPCNVDLFADRTNYQLKRYFSWKPDPHAESFDAFIQD